MNLRNRSAAFRLPSGCRNVRQKQSAWLDHDALELGAFLQPEGLALPTTFLHPNGMEIVQPRVASSRATLG